MKPANGSYRLTYQDPTGSTLRMDVVIDGDVMRTNFGDFEWVDPPGLFRRSGVTPQFAVLFNSSTVYAAQVGTSTYSGTYAPIQA